MGRFVFIELRGLFLLLILFILADSFFYQQALPVVIDQQAGQTTLQVGSEKLSLGSIADPVSLQLPTRDPVVHEYQLDGTDTTNNFTLDTTYLHGIADSPYYIFQAWMRNLDGTSRWSDLRVSSNGQVWVNKDWPENGESFSFPQQTPQSTFHLQISLRRPETPMRLKLTLADKSVIQIALDRDNHRIIVTHDSKPLAKVYFPVDASPFAAMVIDTLLRTLAWSIVLLMAVILCEIALALTRCLWALPGSPAHEEMAGESPTAAGSRLRISLRTIPLALRSSRPPKIWGDLTRALHPIALVALVASFCFVAWISRAQYHAEPHIYDASAYLFAAKMYATGHLAAPAPEVLDRFPGPFMIQYDGQWFTQYPPGTGLTLVPGIWVGVPWLVEPVLGTLALLGIGLIAARLFDRRVATLAVVLGALSPFYSYIAASFLSHAVALFYLTWGLWALLRFFQGEAGWNLPLAAFLFGMGYLTRSEPALLFIVITVAGLILLYRRRVRDSWRLWLQPALNALAIVCVFFALNLQFNTVLTHNPLITPRFLFSASDRWGFGTGIGFYGQHTLAAGLMNLDQLLTILAIDLYGWPFYLTLAFLAMPFLTRRATGADWFCLVCLAVLTGAYVGYFYHGIYLGPRYLFETLPFLLILTARGIFTLAEAGRVTAARLSQHFSNRMPQGSSLSIPTVVLVFSLVLFNLLYFLPRQIVLHQDYTGLSNGRHLDVAAIYHPALHNAIVVTNDYYIYQMVLFSLNDPFLKGDVLYAWARNASEYNELRAAFPGKQLYRLSIAQNGLVSYTRLSQ